MDEEKKAFYLSLLRGLLHFHQRSTLGTGTAPCNGKVNGICPETMRADAYSEALETAIKALEAYELPEVQQ